MNQVKCVTSESVEMFLAEHDNLLVVDLRDLFSYHCGHLSNAVNVGKGDLRMLLSNANQRLSILFYCHDGSHSLSVAELFIESGFTACYYLSGGYESWCRQKASTSETATELPTALVHWLESQGFDRGNLNAYNDLDLTPLMAAAKQGKTDYVLELLERGVNVDLRNGDGNSALWFACLSGNSFTLTALVEAGADLDIQNVNGATPLILSASAERLSMVRILVLAGANVNLKTRDDFSALDVASTASILKFLSRAVQGSLTKADHLWSANLSKAA